MATTEIRLGAVARGGEEFVELPLTLAGTEAGVPAGSILARSTSTNKLVPYVKAGVTNGNGVPFAVLTYEVPVEAGDILVRALVRGRVELERLVNIADGDGSNVDNVEIGLLAAVGIVAESVQELSS